MDLVERTASRYEVVERIMNIGEAPDGYLFQLQWKNLQDKRDWTCNSITDLYADIPDMVKDFISKCKSKKTILFKVKRQLNLN